MNDSEIIRRLNEKADKHQIYDLERKVQSLEQKVSILEAYIQRLSNQVSSLKEAQRESVRALLGLSELGQLNPDELNNTLNSLY